MTTVKVDIFKYTTNMWRNFIHGTNRRLIFIQNFETQLTKNITGAFMHVSFNFNISKISFNFDPLTGTTSIFPYHGCKWVAFSCVNVFDNGRRLRQLGEPRYRIIGTFRDKVEVIIKLRLKWLRLREVNAMMDQSTRELNEATDQ